MKNKKIWLNIIFVAIILGILLFYVFKQGDVGEIINVIKTANYAYIGIAVGLIGIYIFATWASLDVILRLKAKISFADSFNIANCGHFYNGITPFASGGQPFQMYYYSKVKVEPNVSASVVMMNFIIHQSVLTILSILALVFYFQELVVTANVAFKAAIITGFSINTLILVLLIAISISKKVKTFFLWLVGTLYKLKPLRKKREATIAKAESFFINFQSGFKEIFSHAGVLILTVVYKVISFLAYFIIPFFIFKALGINVGAEKIGFIIWMTAFAFVIMSFMPTPGASGGAEWAFNEAFIGLAGMTQSIALSAILLWRFLTYYLLMLLGAISAIFVKKRKEEDIDENCDIHG